jgi:hypothetical protein
MKLHRDACLLSMQLFRVVWVESVGQIETGNFLLQMGRNAKSSTVAKRPATALVSKIHAEALHSSALRIIAGFLTYHDQVGMVERVEC